MENWFVSYTVLLVTLHGSIEECLGNVDGVGVGEESGGEGPLLGAGGGGGGRVADVADGEVERSQDHVDQVTLGAAEGGEQTNLGVEEHAEEGSKQLGNDDGGEDGEEEGDQLNDFVKLEEVGALVGVVGISLGLVVGRGAGGVGRLLVGIGGGSIGGGRGAVSGGGGGCGVTAVVSNDGADNGKG